MFKKSLFIILNLLILFTPKFIYLPKWTWIMAILGLLVFFDKKAVRNLGLSKQTVLIFISFWGFSFSLSLLMPAINNTYDFSYLELMIGLFLAVMRGILLAYIAVKFYKFNLDQYIEIFIDTCVLYVFITMMLIFFPEFKTLWFESIIIPVTVAYPEYYPYRIGIEGYAGFSTAQIFSIGILLSTYKIIQPNNKKIAIKNLVKYLIVIAGSFLYGRVAVIPIVLSLFYIVFFSKNKSKSIKIIFSILLISYIGGKILFFLGENNPQLYRWNRWAFELFINFFERGTFSSHSSTHMLNDMIFLVEGKTFLFGDGIYSVGGKYYMSTDVGFMRAVLFFGVFGLISNYSMIFVIGISIKKYFKINNNHRGVILITLVIINAFIFEVKGEVFQRFIFSLIPLYCIAQNDLNVMKAKFVNKAA